MEICGRQVLNPLSSSDCQCMPRRQHRPTQGGIGFVALVGRVGVCRDLQSGVAVLAES